MSDYQSSKLQVFENTVKRMTELRDTLERFRLAGALSAEQDLILDQIKDILAVHDFRISPSELARRG